MSDAPRLSRRDLIGAGAAIGAGALAASPLLARAGEGVAAAAARRCAGKLTDIEHIVILMQENRSFDQYFGTFPGVRGFDDKRNRIAFRQLGYTGTGNVNGKLLPFHLNGRQPVGQCVTDPTHDWGPQHVSRNGGANNKFYEAHAPAEYDGPAAPTVMGYFGSEDIPFYWRLAQEYTLCDAYYCSVLGPTQPNRAYAVSAWLGQDGENGGPTLSTKFDINGFVGDFTWTTMPELLSARGITWKSYTQVGGQFDNIFTCFSKFKTDPALKALGIDPVYPQDFMGDLARGELPQVSFIQVAFNESEHAAFPPALGEYAASQVLHAIWDRPEIWRKTAVIINYDENGGFFDHVAPPVPEPGTKGEYLTMSELPPEASGIRGPIGLGFRVPCMVVSPWSRGGLVCREALDHTSVLRLIERRWGVEVPNLSEWRRSVTGDMTEAFDFASKPDFSVPRLPHTSNTSPLTTTAQCTTTDPPPYPVPSHIRMPKQVRSRRRPRRPSGIC
jgi:phospholipase C